jgi:hypothetical protein
VYQIAPIVSAFRAPPGKMSLGGVFRFLAIHMMKRLKQIVPFHAQVSNGQQAQRLAGLTS